MDFRSLKSHRASRLSTKSFVPANDLATTSNDNPGSPSTSAPEQMVIDPSTSNEGESMSVEPTPESSQTIPRWQAHSRGQSGLDEPPNPNPPITKGMEWEGLYTSLPPSLEIQVSPETSRGIYAKGGYKPGDVLLALKPHVSTLSTTHLDSYCSSCFSPSSPSRPLKRCPKCKVIMYCDGTCQSRDWSSHKPECPAIQRWMSSPSPSEEEGSSSSVSDQQQTPQPPNDAIRTLGRILWRKQKSGPTSPWSKEIDNLQSHRTSLSKDSNSGLSSASEIYTKLAHGLIHYLGLKSPQELEPFGIHSAADLVDLVSRFTTNTFTITSPTLTPLGACVSPLVALFNHSCDPNAVVVFPRSFASSMANEQGKWKEHEPLLQVVAIKYIKLGEQVLTSYIDTTLPRQLRRKALKETYHFVCRCTLCVPIGTAPPVDLREAMWCPRKCGGVCLLPTEESPQTHCSKCHAPVKDPEPILDVLRIGQEALDKAERVQYSDPAKSLQLTSNLIPLLTSAGLVPGAHPLLALTRLHTSFLIDRLPDVLSSLPAFTLPSGSRPLNISSNIDVEEVVSPQLQGSKEEPSDSEKRALTDTQEALDETVRSSTRSSSGLSQILIYGHPVRGGALAELGKLLVVDEPYPKHLNPRNADSNKSSGSSTPTTANANAPGYPPSGPSRLRLAHSTLVSALNELKVGFGNGRLIPKEGEVGHLKTNEGGETGDEIRRMVVDVEKELSVWKEGVKNVLEGELGYDLGGKR